VTLVHRGAAISPSVKYWIKPDIENRIKNHEIAAFFNSVVREITAGAILIETPEGERRLKNDFVLAMTGYHPDFGFLRALGVQLSEPSSKPVVHAATLESNVAGVYLAGVVIAGRNTSEVFIENGRHHGRLIARDLRRRLGEATLGQFVPGSDKNSPSEPIPSGPLRNAE
jgi:bacillithiol disulfide reductase